MKDFRCCEQRRERKRLERRNRGRENKGGKPIGDRRLGWPMENKEGSEEKVASQGQKLRATYLAAAVIAFRCAADRFKLDILKPPVLLVVRQSRPLSTSPGHLRPGFVNSFAAAGGRESERPVVTSVSTFDLLSTIGLSIVILYEHLSSAREIYVVLRNTLLRSFAARNISRNSLVKRDPLCHVL